MQLLFHVDMTGADSYHQWHWQIAQAPEGYDTLIKQDLVQRVVDRGVPRVRAEQAVEAVFRSMKSALVEGDRIELRGFGVFSNRPRKTGIGRNPRTGLEVSIEPGRAVRFKPGRELQALDGVAGPVESDSEDED